VLTDLPDDFNVHPKLKRQFDKRPQLFYEDEKVDWAFAETMAFGSLLQEGTRVRLSGQDSRRATFSQRHAVLIDQETGEEYTPLNNLSDDQARLLIYDSLLSEYAVAGFEYGYSVMDANALVCWEAQFGDFANGAQIVWDQFLSAAEQKWGQTSSLVALLPHAYEGQGPEHSSARLERFLQLCAEQNMIVANFSTPANYFHALRRQVKRDVNKPLVIMTPKSLLRHPKCVSTPQELTDGGVQEVIPADTDPADTTRHILCSGKVYYDLVKALEDNDRRDEIAITRLEQFYPFPEAELQDELERYADADETVWVQEEPQNMGAWTFVESRLDALLDDVHGHCEQRIQYVGRPASASPATGSAKVHDREQELLVHNAIDV
jgi:2-oxoglutarate dehydrogenase E1 component